MQRLLKASVLIAAIALVTASLVTADTTKQNLIDEWNAKGNPTVKFAAQADVNETEPLNDTCPGESFTPGDVYHGELTTDDCDWVEFSCNAGDRVVIETGPEAGLPTVDTFLELYSDNCNFFEASDDDAGAGLYSRIEGTIVVDATFQVKVRGFSGASTGFYQLSITCTPPPPPNG
ncbi:MAG: hypothetical protein HKN21_15055, partial [Candidatus Eisenbacteria bacterium]|nr:hypothetical protein [Candidatus Eisenbacteria bacterium]